MQSLSSFEKRIQQLEKLVEVSLTLNSTRNLDEILQHIIKNAAEILNCEAASILLHDEKRNRLIFVATGSDPKTLAKIPVPMEGSLAGNIFRENRAILLNDVSQDPRHYRAVGEQINFQPRSLVGVPMRIKDKVVGVLEALNKQEGEFTAEDEKLLTVVASQAAIALNNARLILALEKAYQDISETDQLKSNFLALASHELRTPLGIIIGYASFLQEEGVAEVTEKAERVLAAADRMRSIIESMTSLQQLQGRGLTFKPRVVPIQLMLKTAYNALRASADERQHVVTLQLPADPLLVTADPERLTPAFINILDNAIRFTPPGGSITICALPESGSVAVEIKDTGIGIAPENLSMIFREFSQVEPHMTRRFEGLGIGLTIAKGLVESQGGRIWASSPGMGQGTSLHIVLPAAGVNDQGSDQTSL
jgi:signal transduction histidine kinase